MWDFWVILRDRRERIYTGNKSLDAAYLAGIAGVLTEFIAGIFFYLYSKTLTQINLFHDKLVDMQKTALVYISEAEKTKEKEKELTLAGILAQGEANKPIQPTPESGAADG